MRFGILFYLGVHEPAWLKDLNVPLFVSLRRLERRVNPPVACHRWAMDSGGFTELHKYGEWRTSPQEFIRLVRKYVNETGMMDWAAPQDWMCESSALAATGLSVEEHQIKTVNNFLELRDALGPILIPVLQGWTRDDYLRCVDMYDQVGVDLSEESTVGLGSVCRRHADAEITAIIESLQPIKLHGFGVKGNCYFNNKHLLASADSMAWSFKARYSPPLEGCTHQACNNCRRYALKWREKMVSGTMGTRNKGVFMTECDCGCECSTDCSCGCSNCNC